MRRDLVVAAKVLALPTLALGFVAGSVPGRLGIAAQIYALVLAATALGVTLAALRRAYPPARPLPRSPEAAATARSTLPPTLVRLEQACALGMARAFDLHYRVRPRLREIAGPLLAVRRGVALDAEPAAARRLLGEETWELVRADRPTPDDRLAPGITVAALGAVVESLERL